MTLPSESFEYQLEGRYQGPIHILRALMFPTGRGVLDREWLVPFMYSGMYSHDEESGSLWNREPFPEFHGKPFPWKLTGERLVERVALLWDYEESSFQRLMPGSDSRVDLEIFVLDGSPRSYVYTSDKTAYETLALWFSRTSNEGSEYCFI